MRKIGIILGTRPEIIKFSPIIRLLEKKNLPFFILHTNQHYSYEMDEIFFSQLSLPRPQFNLHTKSKTQNSQVAEMMIGIEEILLVAKPKIILVQGDTNSAFSGAFSASKLGISVGHVEAGLRSYDKTMPEEINRILIDHISDFLFCPTSIQREILLNEGIEDAKIYVTGNTISDAIQENLRLAGRGPSPSIPSDLPNKKYCLVTLHRPSNVDQKESLEYVFRYLKVAQANLGLPFIFTVHPRTNNSLSKYKINLSEGFSFIPPVSYWEMLKLVKNARFVFTDSGGLQEEACILNTPCITLRPNTERPETLSVGSNILMRDIPPEKIADFPIPASGHWENPFGSHVSEKIIAPLEK